MLRDATAWALIRAKAQQAIDRLGEMKPPKHSGPVEVKAEITTRGTGHRMPGHGIEQVDRRTLGFHGKTFLDAWLKYRPME